MRRIVLLCTVLLMSCTFVPWVGNAKDTSIVLYVNGEKVTTKAQPKFTNERLYILMEDLAELIEAEVSWNADQSVALLSTEHLKLSVQADQQDVLINGANYSMSAKSVVENGQMWIPIEDLGEPLGYKVVWDALTSSVFLYKRDLLSPTTIVDETEEFVQELKLYGPGDEHGWFVEATSDHVRIMSKSEATPSHFYLDDSMPYRIVIDYDADAFGFDGTNASGIDNDELMMEASSPYIQKIRYALNDQDTIRFVIELKHPAVYTLSYENGVTDVHLTGSSSTYKSNYKIVIDAGHGGKDPGATGYSGRYEKYFTLELSLKIAARINQEPELQAFMTRTDDTFIELEDRAAFANELNADLFISIHGNTFTRDISGTETYYYESLSKPFSSIIHEHVLEATGLNDRGVRSEPYKVLRLAEMPAVLLELGYLSTPSDEALMLSESFQDRVAEAIVAGIKQYFSIP